MDLLGLERGISYDEFISKSYDLDLRPHHWVCLVGISDTKKIVTNPCVNCSWVGNEKFQHIVTNISLRILTWKKSTKKKSLLQQPGDSKWRPFDSLVGGHWTSERVTFSPSQKGHKELSGRREGELFSTSLWFPAKKSITPRYYGRCVHQEFFQPIPLQLIWLVPFLRWKRTLSSNFRFGSRKSTPRLEEKHKHSKKISGIPSRKK